MEKTNGNDSINAIITPDGEKLQFGLTKREYFAALAMQGILANSAVFESAAVREIQIEKTAVEFADALIRALNKEQEVPTTSPDPNINLVKG